jgi:hypothetical protein
MTISSILNRIVKNLPPEKAGCGDFDGTSMLRWRISGLWGYAARLHRFVSDDSDPMHDHPVSGISVILCGSYIEETPQGSRIRRAGSVQFIGGKHIHRVMMNPAQRGETWSLFVHTPKWREWGVWVEGQWMQWREYRRKVPCRGVRALPADSVAVTRQD